MTTAGPWSVKGIDPKAREIAKDLARRSGLTLGEWLNQMIVEGLEEAPPIYIEPPVEQETAREASSGARARPQTGGRAAAGWRDAARAPAPAPAASSMAAPVLSAESFRSRLREAGRGGDAGEVQRVTRALSDLTARIEAAEHRSTLAISGIDQQAMGVLSRLEGAEHDHTSAAARFDGALEEVRTVQATLADRLRRMEDEDGPRIEAMKALEGALGKVAAQIYEGESRTRAQSAQMREDLTSIARRVDRVEAIPAPTFDTTDVDGALAQLAVRMDEAQGRTGAAVRALETSFASLDQRLTLAEAPRPEPSAQPRADEAERRFERLAAELSERVDSARADMAARLRDAADGKLDRMEAALRDLSGQVAEAEKTSAGAIDRMGREVVRIAQGLHGRLGEVEHRAKTSAAEVEGGMARIAEAVEGRIARADGAQAEALEKLGGEIARIAERLADRIASSERRAAQELARGLEEVGDKVGRATDKLNTRYDHAAADLAERIRASEARTARLLDEARIRMEPRAPQPEAEAIAAPAPIPAPAPAPAWVIEDAAEDAEEPSTFDSPADEIDHFEQAFEPGPFGRPRFPLDEDRFAPAADLDGFDADDDFATSTPAPRASFTPEPPRPSSTRELIENARAAARAQADAKGRRGSRTAPAAPVLPPAEEELFAAHPGFEEGVEAPPRIAPARRGFGLPRLRRRESSSTVATALTASGVAAFVAVAGVGAVWMVAENGGRAPVSAEAPTAVARPLFAASPPAMLAVAQAPVEASIDAASPLAVAPPLAAEALKPEAEAASSPAAIASARTLYNQAVRELERGDVSGAETLRRAADLGYAPAQFHLGKLYEDGLSGVRKDMAQARRWTERAARGGDAKAMYNLGLYLADGEGAQRDDRAALQWFHRAADGGVKDAQFNVAVMHQNGRGAPASAVEAYKWFLIAAADGDAGARRSAEALKPSLTLDAQAVAERSAVAYRAQIASALSAAQVRTASR